MQDGNHQYDIEMQTLAALGRNSTITDRPTLIKRIFPHEILCWITVLLAVSFFLLTSIYAWNPEVVARNELLCGSPAKALQVLAILSMVSSWLIASSMSQSFSLALGMLIAQVDGLRLVDNLTLQPGTGLDGLLEILFKKNMKRMQSRLWSVGKILSMIIVTIVGIVILSNVEAIPIFYQKTREPVAQSYSVGPFNASLATLLQPLADSLYGTRFKDFLSDSDLVVETSSVTDGRGCRDRRGENVCHSKFFVPGGIEQFAPRALSNANFTSDDDIQPVLVKSLKGLYFEFESNDGGLVAYNQRTECIRHGYRLASYQLCLKDTDSQKIDAFLTVCPKDIAINLGCMNNSIWPPSGGWRTRIATFSRSADVAYNGLNGTILSFQFPNALLSPVNVNASALRFVFNTMFDTSNSTSNYGKILSRIGIGTNKPFAPFTIWQYFQGLEELSKTDHRAQRRATLALQSLLAIPIYHCQAKDFAELRRLLLDQTQNASLAVQGLAREVIEQFPISYPDTSVYPALLRYTLNVGKGSLLAYIILAGCTLLLCIVTNVMGSWTTLGRNSRHLGPFPLLNHLIDCETVDKHGSSISLEKFLAMGRKGSISDIAEMSVILKRPRNNNQREMPIFTSHIAYGIVERSQGETQVRRHSSNF